MVRPVSPAHLLLATRQRDKETVSELLKADPNVASSVADGGETALQIAAHQGDEELCRLLLGSSTKTIDYPTPVEKLTPLHIVAARGYLQLCELLLTNGARADLVDARGYTALHHAAWKGHASVCRALLTNDSLHVDVQAITKGETPLILAALMRREDCVRVLLDSGADVGRVLSVPDKEYIEKVRNVSAKKTRSGRSTVLANGGSPSQGGGSQGGANSLRNSTTSLRVEKPITPVEVPPPGVPSPGGADGGSSVNERSASSRSLRSGASSPINMSIRKGGGAPPSPLSSKPTGIVNVPQGSRRSRPMYKLPCTNSSSSKPQQGQEEAKVELEKLTMKGLSESLLFDPTTNLVFYQAPCQGPLRRQTVSPLLVGKLLVGGLGNKVVPLTADDAPTLELSPTVLRCLRRGNRAALWLHDCSMVQADVAPEVGCTPMFWSVSLMVPLCAILGVAEVAEIGQLGSSDLEMCDADANFLLDLITAFEQTADGSGPEKGADPQKSRSSQLQPTTPTMPQLLVEYGLVKLLPLAGEVGAAGNIQRWHLLGPAAANMGSGPGGLSRFESARLREMMARAKVLQDADLDARAGKMAQLQRLSTGSVVLYEVMCRVPPPADRGTLLLGVIIDDLGPEAEKRFKVRDLVDDAIVRTAAGQLTRATPAVAMAHLRSDLLPPLSSGAPVVPLTAVVGLPVQLAYGHWAYGPDSPQLEGINRVSARNLVGFLDKMDDPDGLRWHVMWPDGEVRLHATGENNLFELAHLQLHRSSGAPLLRTHVHTLLGGAEATCVPVVRSPLWSRSATDDTVPGSVGVAVLDASQTALQVLWSRSRSNMGASPMYSPDGRGVYPLCHGIMQTQPVTMFNAKEGLTVECGPGFLPEPGTATGVGTMLFPTRIVKGGRAMTWQVRWESGDITQHQLGVEIPKSPVLMVSSNFMSEQQSDRAIILNEVSGLRQAGASKGVSYTPAANMLGRSHFGKGAAALISGAAPLETQPLLLGEYVKLNMLVMHLQPGCVAGPLAAYEPVPLSAQLKAKKEGRKLEPVQRDDVGIVVRDMGRGVYRGLMVRKLGSTDGWWYDETVLLPANQGDVSKQVARVGEAYMMPRHLQGVIVTDANSAPGMLVQRAYRSGAALDGSAKSMLIGYLVRQPSPHTWKVQWPDGTSQLYLTGSNGRFQLCFAQTHWYAGAPLMASTARSRDGFQQPIAVVDCMHALGGGMPPGTMRYVNDPPTQAALLQCELAQMEPADVVATSFGERLFAGGVLQLYELAHAILPGEWVTVYTAKRGLRVELHTSKKNKPSPLETQPLLMGEYVRGGGSLHTAAMADFSQLDGGGGDAEVNEEAVTRARRPKGTLVQPVKLISVKLKGGVEVGGTRTPSHVALDPKRVYWDVQWDDGTVGQYLIGTKEGDTSLQVLGRDMDPVIAPCLCDNEHFLRFLGSVVLLDSGNKTINDSLVSMADSFHKAIQWHNQMLQELCKVWWSSAAAVAAASGVRDAALGAEKGTFHLWRPQLELLGYQPDQLVLEVRSRDAPWLGWKGVGHDPEMQIGPRVSNQADRRLAQALHDLIAALGQVGVKSQDGPAGVHLTLNDVSSFLDPFFVLGPDSKSIAVPASLAPLIHEFNSTLAVVRANLRGETDSTGEGSNMTDLLDLGLNLEPSLGLLSLAPTALGVENSPDIRNTTGRGLAQVQGGAEEWDKKNTGSGLLAWLVQEVTPERLCIITPATPKTGGGEEEKEEAEEEVMDAGGDEDESQAKERAGARVEKEAREKSEEGAATPDKTGRTDKEKEEEDTKEAGDDDGDKNEAKKRARARAEARAKAKSEKEARAKSEKEAEAMREGEAAVLNRSKGPLLYVGPAQLLSSGIQLPAQAALLQLQRSLCALSCASSLNVPRSGESSCQSIRLVGKAPCLWLEASELELVEGAMPKDPAVARCRAAVNASIFNLWRMTAGLGGAGGGSGDISTGLMEMMRIVHAKASAQVATESALRSYAASLKSSKTAADYMLEAVDMSGEIDAFAAGAVHHLLSQVDLALHRLHFAQATADATIKYASTASPPNTYIWESEDVERAKCAGENARQAVCMCQDNTRKAFPDMAHATMKAAKSVVQTMCANLTFIDALTTVAVEAKTFAEERSKASDSAIAARSRLMTDVQELRDKQLAKLKEVQTVRNSLESTEDGEDRQKLDAAAAKLGDDARSIADKAETAEAHLDKEHAAVARIASEANSAAEEAEQKLLEANLMEPQKAVYFCKNGKGDNFHRNVTKAESVLPPVNQARAAVEAAVAALRTLDKLKHGLPAALRSADGALRLLSSLRASTAAVAVRAAAEWSRTASLAFIQHQMKSSLEERKVARSSLAAKQAVKEEEDIKRYISWREDWLAQMAKNGNVVNAPAGGNLAPPTGAAKAPPQAYKPQLPDEETLTMMVDAGVLHLPSALKVYLELRHEVDPSIKMEMEDNLMQRSLQAACATLDAIARLAAESNKPSALAALLAEATTTAKVTPTPEGAESKTILPSTLEDTAVRYVALAITHERKAADVSKALNAISAALSADPEGEVMPPAVSKAVLAATRTGSNYAKGATQDVVRAINDQLKHLGGSATVAGLKAKALSRLATKTTVVSTAGVLVMEAVQALGEAKAEANALLHALIPPPLPEAVEGEDHEEAAEKAKEVAVGATPGKSAAALREAERGIQAFMSSAAVDVANSACSWGMQLIDPLNDPGSLPKAPLPLPLGMAEDPDVVDVDEDKPTVDHMLRVMGVLPNVLAACDAALRSGGNHPGLLEVEDSVHSFMRIVTEATRRRAKDYYDAMGKCTNSAELAYSMHGPRADAIIAAATQALAGAERTMDAAPLIMPPLDAERKLREAQEVVRKLLKLAADVAIMGKEYAEEKKEREAKNSIPEERKRTGATLQLRLLLTRGTGFNPQGTTTSSGSATAMPAAGAGSNQKPLTCHELAAQPWDVSVQFVPMVMEAVGLSSNDWHSLTEADATVEIEQMANSDHELLKLVTNGGTDFKTNIVAAKEALQRPALAALLRPYKILMSARNKVAAAAAAAEISCPDPAKLLESSLLGSTEVPPHVVSANLRQFRRWGLSVANIAASGQLVLRGFMRARLEALEQLPPIEVPADMLMP